MSRTNTPRRIIEHTESLLQGNFRMAIDLLDHLHGTRIYTGTNPDHTGYFI